MPAAGERWGGSGSAACARTASKDDDRRSQCSGGTSVGHDKNGNLLGFATTDEIGSVTDMTKRRKTKTNGTSGGGSGRGGDGSGGLNGYDGWGRRANGTDDGAEEDEAGEESREVSVRAAAGGEEMIATAEYGSNPPG